MFSPFSRRPVEAKWEIKGGKGSRRTPRGARQPTVIKRDLGEPSPPLSAAKILRNGIRGLIRVQKPISRGPRNFIVSNSFENRVTPITSRDSPVIREFDIKSNGSFHFSLILLQGELKGNFIFVESYFSSSSFFKRLYLNERTEKKRKEKEKKIYYYIRDNLILNLTKRDIYIYFFVDFSDVLI